MSENANCYDDKTCSMATVLEMAMVKKSDVLSDRTNDKDVPAACNTLDKA